MAELVTASTWFTLGVFTLSVIAAGLLWLWLDIALKRMVVMRAELDALADKMTALRKLNEGEPHG